MKFLKILRFRKTIREYQLEKKKNQDYRILNNNTNVLHSYHGIKYDINPFLYVGTKDKKYLEDIVITYDTYFEEPYPVHYIVRYPYINVKQRKNLVDEIIKRWEYDYYKSIDEKLKRIFEQASFIPIKNVQKIKNRTIYAYMFFALIFLVLLKQYSFLQLIPYIGVVFTKINRLLIHRRFYNFTSLSVYLAIMISMYLIIVKVYFDKVLQYGLSAKGFLIKERDRMLRKFKPNIKIIRKRLYQLTKKLKLEEKYEINQLYNWKIVVQRIEKYGINVINRVGYFTSYYKPILLISKILRFIYIVLIGYLLISLLRINQIILW